MNPQECQKLSNLRENSYVVLLRTCTFRTASRVEQTATSPWVALYICGGLYYSLLTPPRGAQTPGFSPSIIQVWVRESGPQCTASSNLTQSWFWIIVRKWISLYSIAAHHSSATCSFVSSQIRIDNGATQNAVKDMAAVDLPPRKKLRARRNNGTYVPETWWVLDIEYFLAFVLKGSNQCTM